MPINILEFLTVKNIFYFVLRLKMMIVNFEYSDYVH